MFRKILKPIADLALKPYFERNKISNQKMDLAKKIYDQGDKQKALEMYNDILKQDASYKPARGRIVEIQDEIKTSKNSFKR